MSPRQRFATMDEYFASVPAESRRILEEIRTLIKSIVPEAEETISYQMPAFKLQRVFIYFAAFKRHIGIYPPVENDENLVEALGPFRGERGNLRFPLDQPMPYDLISRVVQALSEQHSKRSASSTADASPD
jgi:uncharacterized protein YdhG (YjbR/CyaY superfamily)